MHYAYIFEHLYSWPAHRLNARRYVFRCPGQNEGQSYQYNSVNQGPFINLASFQRSMQSTYVRTLLYDISAKLGRKPQDMERFIAILEQQWYDSKQALAKLTPNDYQRLQIPDRLATAIAEAVGAGKTVAKRGYEKMDIESPIESELAQLRTKLSQPDFQTAVQLLNRIFTNIRENLIEEKYRTLKKSNAKINAMSNYRQIVQVLKFGGFQDLGSAFVMNKVNISTIDDCMEGIGKFLPEVKFNPYQSHISSIGKTTVQNYEGPSSVMYNQMLAELEKERTRVMSQPVNDRKIKVYQVEGNAREFDKQFQEDRESQDEEKYIELENVKQMLKKQGEEPKFINRRMQEYLDLVKKPVFAETTIRVKLGDSWVFECRFTPLETLETLCDVFRDCLENKNLDYYLYMTPPVQKLSGIILRKTFYELGCVPRAVFYFKCEQELKGNIFRIQKSKLFGY